MMKRSVDKEMKVNRAMPILRGDAILTDIPIVPGNNRITTDMPDIDENRVRLVFRYVKQMDPERII